MNTPIKVAMADDNQLLLAGLKDFFRENQDETPIEMVWTAHSPELLLEKLRTARFLPDILLLDISFQGAVGKEGIALCKEIKENYPAVKIIFFTMYGKYSKLTVRKALQHNPNGYLLKSQSLREVVDGIRQVYRKCSVWGPGIFDLAQEERPVLSPREEEILLLISNGHRPGEMAELLHVSVDTINTHKKNLKRKIAKCQCSDIELYKAAVQWGYLEAE